MGKGDNERKEGNKNKKKTLQHKHTVCDNNRKTLDNIQITRGKEMVAER